MHALSSDVTTGAKKKKNIQEVVCSVASHGDPESKFS